MAIHDLLDILVTEIGKYVTLANNIIVDQNGMLDNKKLHFSSRRQALSIEQQFLSGLSYPLTSQTQCAFQLEIRNSPLRMLH